MNLLDYLDEHLVPRTRLVQAAAIDDAQLRHLQECGAVPLPSYRLALEIGCESYFGPHVEHAAREYYPTGSAGWIAAVGASDEPPRHLFIRRYRARLAQLQASGIATAHAKLNAGLDQHLQEEWTYFLDGTYGLCTRTGSPEDIAAKELAATIIVEITGNGSKRALTVAQLTALRSAVDLLDAASAPFAPHEAARSSRRRLVDDVRAAYFPASANCLR